MRRLDGADWLVKLKGYCPSNRPLEDKRPIVLILLVYQDGMLNSRQTTVMLVLVSWIISLVLALIGLSTLKLR